VSVSTASSLAEALEEVFRETIEVMFGLPLEGPEPAESHQEISVSGIVGLAGPAFRAQLLISCSRAAACTLTATLVGDEELLEKDPSLITDGLAELANMVGGGLKRRIDASGVDLELSLPSVLEGSGRLQGAGGSMELSLSWRIQGAVMETVLLYSTGG